MTLHLVAPGLLEPPPGLAAPPRVPTLERYLAGSRRERFGPADPTALLFLLAGITVDSDCDPPSAPVCLLGDGGDPGRDYWLHADPVTLVADRDRLILLRPAPGELAADEAAGFIERLNHRFANEECQFVAPSPEHWYLRLARPMRLVTHPTDKVAGRPLDRLYPQGPDRARAARLMNEIQVALFTDPVNVEREARGASPVNALWLWGGGTLPIASSTPCDLMIGTAPLLKGVARLLGIQQMSLPVGRVADGIWFEESLAGPLEAPAWAGRIITLDERIGTLDGLRGDLNLYPVDGTRFRRAKLGAITRLFRASGLAAWLQGPVSRR